MTRPFVAALALLLSFSTAVPVDAQVSVPSEQTDEPVCDGEFSNGCDWEVREIEGTAYYNYILDCPGKGKRTMTINHYGRCEICQDCS